MLGTEWITEAETRLQKTYDQIRSKNGQGLTSKFDIDPALDGSEAEYFVRGLDSDVFSIDDEGYIESVALPPSKNGKKNKQICLFWTLENNQRTLFREGVCQVSTLGSLTLKYGCHPNQIRMEPTFPTLRGLNWAVDMLLRSPEGIDTAVCEVKRNNHELNLLIEGLQYCCKETAHLKRKCKFEKNHPKYALCRAIKPEYFLAVSPGRKICFHLSYEEAFILSKEVPLSALMEKLLA